MEPHDLPLDVVKLILSWLNMSPQFVTRVGLELPIYDTQMIDTYSPPIAPHIVRQLRSVSLRGQAPYELSDFVEARSASLFLVNKGTLKLGPKLQDLYIMKPFYVSLILHTSLTSLRIDAISRNNIMLDCMPRSLVSLDLRDFIGLNLPPHLVNLERLTLFSKKIVAMDDIFVPQTYTKLVELNVDIMCGRVYLHEDVARNIVKFKYYDKYEFAIEQQDRQYIPLRCGRMGENTFSSLRHLVLEGNQDDHQERNSNVISLCYTQFDVFNGGVDLSKISHVYPNIETLIIDDSYVYGHLGQLDKLREIKIIDSRDVILEGPFPQLQRVDMTFKSEVEFSSAISRDIIHCDYSFLRSGGT
jgi:hypothetical protein